MSVYRRSGHTRTMRLFAGKPRKASGLRPFFVLGLALAISACQEEAHWPLTCSPGESIGFRPPDSSDEGTWRQWNWKAGESFVLTRTGEAPHFAYLIEHADVGWSDVACNAEPDGKHIVCDSGKRRMRLNVKTLRFVVASETGYREETNNPKSDRADVALGVCRSRGSS